MKSLIKKIILLLVFVFSKKIKQPPGLLVLTYHRVSNEADNDDPLKVSKGCFDKQIKYLKNNYTIVSGSDLYEAIESGNQLPDNACLITFDDGWRDNYTRAFPILKKHAVPALIFISTNFISSNKIFWHEKIQYILRVAPIICKENTLEFMVDKWPDEIIAQIYRIISRSNKKRSHGINVLISELKMFDPVQISNLIVELEKNISSPIEEDRLMLTWEEILEMSENNIEFGSHTQNHVILTQVKKEEVYKELEGSRNILEKKIGKRVSFLSYPNGNYDDYVLDVTRLTGYLSAFTCVSGINESLNEVYEIKRKHIRENFSSGLTGKYSDVYFKIDLLGVREFVSKNNIFS